MNTLEIIETTDGFIAVFTGTTGENEDVTAEEAHNIEGKTKKDRETNALMIWGAETDNTVIVHI